MLFASQEPDLLDWLLDVVRMKQGVIAQGLGVGLGISAAYFLVMMLTRWGDRHTLPKALVFSGFIHLVSVAGYVAVVASPSNLPAPKFQTEKEQETESINVQLLSEDPQQLSKEGNTPVWSEPLKPTEPLMARNDQRNLKPVPFEDPQREVVPLEKKEAPELPDLKPTLPEDPPEVPQPIPPNLEPNPRAPAEISQDAPELITSPEPQESKIQRQRNAVPQRGPFNTPINRQPMRGATDRVNRDVDPKRELASLETPDDPKAYIKRGPERGVFKHRSSPAPAFGPLPKLGAPDIQGDVETPAGQRVPNRPKRLVNRESLDRIDPNIARQKSDRLPDPTDPVRRRTFPPAPINTPDLMDDRISPVPIRPLLNTPRMGRRVALPSTYRYRGPEQRRKAALQFGGSEASERAVEEALKWLATHQTAEGFWDADAHGAGEVKLARKLVRDEKTGRDVWQEFDDRNANITRENHGLAGPNADSGVTALAILAFLGAGYTHEDGPYAGQVDKALEWLIGQQREDGYLGGKASYFARAYCHGIATYALAEAYGMRSDPTLPSKLKEPLEKAVHYMLVRQNPQTGGWRYLPYDDRPITAQNGQTRFAWNRETDPGDMSIFGWNLMALKSAELADIKIPEQNRNLLIKFLKDRGQGRDAGLAGYYHGENKELKAPSPSMTAEALFSKQMLGMERTHPASREAVSYLLRNRPQREKLDFYYWYYGTLAVFQYGGEPWKQWNESLRDMLVTEQRANGTQRGSWDPKDRWGGYGGRVYSTALNALILEVYYRFLPLYQMGGRYAEQ